MTTAARPTWAPAKGGNEQGGTRIFGTSLKYSSRDIASHTTLKPRKEGQDTQDELQRKNLCEELEACEQRYFSSKDKGYAEDRDRRKGSQLLLEGAKREVEDRIVSRNIEADDADVDVKSDDESEQDDDDDTEALLAELEQIKKERAEEKLRKVWERVQCVFASKLMPQEYSGIQIISIVGVGGIGKNNSTMGTTTLAQVYLSLENKSFAKLQAIFPKLHSFINLVF